MNNNVVNIEVMLTPACSRPMVSLRSKVLRFFVIAMATGLTSMDKLQQWTEVFCLN